MYFSIIHRTLTVIAIVLGLCAATHAAVVDFLGAETGDTSECTGSVDHTNGTLTADNSFANSGGWSYKWTTTASTAPTVNCNLTLTATATYTMDYYLKVDSAPASLGSNAFELGFIASTGTSAVVWYLETTAGDVPSLQLYNLQSAAQIGSTVPVVFGTTYRIVVEATAGASGEYKMLVCQGASCTTVDSGTINTGTGSMSFLRLAATNTSSMGAAVVHADDVLITNTFADPGPHEVLARQFNAAGTYTGWVPNPSGSCPANWNQTPNTNNPYCQNAVTGASTCAGGVTACETGVTHFDSTTGAGNTGFGSQTISTSQTINAVKIAVFGDSGTGTTDVDSAVFIDSGASETDTALAAWGGVIAFQEVYLASTPTAPKLIGAQAGFKHDTTTTHTHFIPAAWLMADVNTTPVTTSQSGVIMP